MQLVDVLIRQAHPGPDAPPYRTADAKLEDARRYRDAEQIAWPVIVDDLAGTVHQVYGGLADPTYLIDVDGRVAYYNLWTHVPTLDRAIDDLLRAGGRGTVLRGTDRAPHMAAAMTSGWRAIRRGLPQSFFDLMIAAPGMPSGLWLGYQLRPALRPVTLRATPLPGAVKLALVAGALVLAAAVGTRMVRRLL